MPYSVPKDTIAQVYCFLRDTYLVYHTLGVSFSDVIGLFLEANVHHNARRCLASQRKAT